MQALGRLYYSLQSTSWSWICFLAWYDLMVTYLSLACIYHDCFPSGVSYADCVLWWYTQLNLVTWSIYKVAYWYLLVVSIPVIWSISPGVGNLSWSTDITSPGLAGSSASFILFLERCLHVLLLIPLYMHDKQTWIVHFSSLLESIPLSAIICSLQNGYFPNLWWNFNISSGRLGSPQPCLSINIFSWMIGVVYLTLLSLNWVVYPYLLKAYSWSSYLYTSLSL